MWLQFLFNSIRKCLHCCRVIKIGIHFLQRRQYRKSNNRTEMWQQDKSNSSAQCSISIETGLVLYKRKIICSISVLVTINHHYNRFKLLLAPLTTNRQHIIVFSLLCVNIVIYVTEAFVEQHLLHRYLYMQIALIWWRHR